MPLSSCVRATLLALFVCVTAVGQQLFCMGCRRTFRVPGGADSGSIGTPRVDSCPLCQPEDCTTAAQRAAALRERYRTRREQYDARTASIAARRSRGEAIPAAEIAQQARDDFELGQLEMQYAILNADCEREVPGDNVWDGLYPGPVPDSPVTAENEAAREARAAAQVAASYERIAQREQQQADVVVAFLNTAADGFAPPAVGYDGLRYEVTRSYRDLADAQRNEATAGAGGAGDAARNVDPKEAIVPKFADVKLAPGGDAYVRDAGIGARTRVEAGVNARAYLQARRLQRRAVAAGDVAAARTQAASALELAWQAKGYAKWAADHQHRADAEHQRRLDASLAAAAAKGSTLPVLLERFQASVAASGLPAPLDAALAGSGATPAERAGVAARLRALTPARVDAVLAERRARIAAGPDVPDEALLDTQFLAAQVAWRKHAAK